MTQTHSGGAGARDVAPEMVNIPAGEFIMGSETGYKNEPPPRRVFVDDFAIAKYPLTNVQYQAFLEANPEQRPPKGWTGIDYPAGRGDHPVVFVNSENAQAYAAWLSRQSGHEFRLPTEAEWEKAARGERGNVYPWGEVFEDERCNSKDSGRGDTTPVGVFDDGSSPYGVMDMAGNVWEWCADWYSAEYYVAAPARNPQGPEEGKTRVTRGGSWDCSGASARCSFRNASHPVTCHDDLGVRLASAVRT